MLPSDLVSHRRYEALRDGHVDFVAGPAHDAARDLPFYDPSISEDVLAGLNRFAREIGLLVGPRPPNDCIVARVFSEIWAMEEA